jgi:hypothetical protein
MTGTSHLSILDKLVLGCLLIYLASAVFQGALRYYAALYGMPAVVYFPKAVIGLLLIPAYGRFLLEERRPFAGVAVIALFWLGMVWGVRSIHDAAQVMFGFWVLLPVLFGMATWRSLERSWEHVTPWVLGLWIVVVMGVFLNSVHDWPWVGMEYELGGARLEAARQWYTFGLPRLPGFSAASFEAATQALLLGIALWVNLRGFWRGFVWIVSGLAILMTTSKTPFVVFLLLTILWQWRKMTVPRGVLLISGALGMLLPLGALLRWFRWMEDFSSSWAILTSSFVMRAVETWPMWIQEPISRGSWLLGAGLGGIGAPTERFAGNLPNAADNIFVYF